MASATKHFQFVEDLAHQVHDLSADTFKVMLTNSAPTTANAVLLDLTEITAEHGYSAGGTQSTISSSGQTSGTYKLVLADVVFTASGGTIGAFRYVDLYNDTPTSPADPLMMWWDYGSSITLADTETFTWDADPTNGIMTLV